METAEFETFEDLIKLENRVYQDWLEESFKFEEWSVIKTFNW
jgi:hypothetical protein